MTCKKSDIVQPHKIIRTYYEFRRVLSQARAARGFSQLKFDDEIGVCQHLTAKIESGYRSYGDKSLDGTLKALKLTIVVIPEDQAVRCIDKLNQKNKNPSRVRTNGEQMEMCLDI